MNKFRFTLTAMAIIAFTVLASSSANAQATRTWVSGVGDDANPCSRTAPCKTFAGAISKTAAGGEIDALDPGGFGALTINKAITIDGGGGIVASVLVSGTNGFVVTAGPSDVVTVVNVRFQGIAGGSNAAGLNGIRFLSGKALNVINCYFWGFSQNGIDVALNQATLGTVFVSNTVVKNCAGDGIALTNAQAGLVKAEIVRSSFVEGGNGLHAKANSRATALDCTFSLNSGNGVFSDAVTAGTVAAVRVQQSQISHNGGSGVRAGNGGDLGTSAVEIGLNQIDFNVGTGALVSTNGLIETYTNNSIHANGTDGCPSCTNVAPGN